MNNELLNGDIEEPYERLIEKCKWRKDLAGIYVCIGECLPCDKTIEIGRCDVLLEYFRKERMDA